MIKVIDKLIVLAIMSGGEVTSSISPNNTIDLLPTIPFNEQPSSTATSQSLYAPSSPSSPTQLPSNTPSLSTTYSQYLVMEVATTWCADGFEPITSSAECKGYADSNEDLAYQISGSYTNLPTGCFIWSGVYVYFNQYQSTAVNDDTSIVCQLVTLPWSASPSYTPTNSVPSNEPSFSNFPTIKSRITPNIPSFTPSSLSPSSVPSAPRKDWWASKPIRILEGYSDNVSSVSFSSNGSCLASASFDSTVKVWSMKNGGGLVETLNEHTDHVFSVDFSHDGTKLVSGAYGSPGVILWNIDNDCTVSFNKVLHLVGNLDHISDVKFSPDGRFIASEGYDNNIFIWSVDGGGKLLHSLKGHSSNVRSLSFSVDSRILASGSDDRSIKLWDMENGGTEIASYTEHTGSVTSLDFSRDGTLLASGSMDDTVKVWNFNNSALSLARNLVRHDSYVFSVKFSRDGKYLASASLDTTIILWNRDDDYYQTERFKEKAAILSIDFSPDGQKIASGSANDVIQIWGLTCEPGKYGIHPECQPCAPGTYKSEADMQTCISCAPGTAQNKTGATECDNCSIGTFQPFEGKPRCEVCRLGGYCANKAADDACDGGFTACPIGTFNNVTGAYNEDSCIECPPGTFHGNQTGLEICFKCPKGTYSNAGSSLCSECGVGTVQNQTGQSSCQVCPPNTFPDQSKIICLACPYRLGSEEKSEQCSFCANDFYLKIPNVKSDNLIKNPANFCLECPSNAHCNKNTTIETLKGAPGFWRDSLQTQAFYECNNITGVCLGGTSCTRGHGGVRCEVCVDKNQYFDSSEGECIDCPSFLKLGIVVGIFTGIVIFLYMMKYIAHQYRRIEWFISKCWYTLTAIGIQGKFKILLTFSQVVTTIEPIYGVRMHSAFASWFRIFDIFYFGLAETFGIPLSCFGSMKVRLMIGAFWPYALALLLVSVMFIYLFVINIQRRNRKDALARFWSLSLYGVIVLFYLVLPSVCQQIFHAITCKSFDSNDSENEVSSYLIADWSVKCENRDSDYVTITQVFWTLFAIWPVAVPLGAFVLIILIRPSVRSNTTTPLAEACRFLWFDYNVDLMFWEVIELVRKISLTGLIIFIDTEEGSERISRLLVAIGICAFYGTILLYARPYKRKDDFDLAILSNLLLTCFFLLSITIHQCKESEDVDGENSVCMKLFGISDSYEATALAVILTAIMLVAFVLFTFIQSVNEFKAPIVRLVSTNGVPHLVMPKGCKYHLFVSHTWASGQDKVHKIVRMLKLYIQGINIWLDVDLLESLGNLEESVKESAHFVLFYSKGYFESLNCRREVVKAMELNKAITVMFEPDDNISLDKNVQMNEEFEMFWPQDSTFPEAKEYIFAKDPIIWMSKGLQFSFESIKLVAGRLLKSLPYYEDNSVLLDAGLKIDGEIKPVEMFTPLDILYCSSNTGADEVVPKLVEECKGDVQACEINLSDTYLQRDNRQAAMLVYLNKNVFRGPNCLLAESIIWAIGENIPLVFVHENDTNKGGCSFRQIIEQTPKELRTEPYSIYSRNIAVSLYSIEEYEKIGIRQLLTKMGAKPAGGKLSRVYVYTRTSLIPAVKAYYFQSLNMQRCEQ